MLNTPEEALRLRMAARVKFAGAPPRFLFSSPRREPDGKWADPEPNVATCGEQRLYRRENESFEEFEDRIAGEFFPANGAAWPFVFFDSETPETPRRA
jgi:hypothetical protein